MDEVQVQSFISPHTEEVEMGEASLSISGLKTGFLLTGQGDRSWHQWRCLRKGGGASATKSSLEVKRPYTLAGAAVGHETHCGPMEKIDAI